MTPEQERNQIKGEFEQIKEQSFAWAVIKEQSNTNKRLCMALIVALCLWFGTIGLFVWLWQQYDYVSETTTTVTQDGAGLNNYNDGGTQGDVINNPD